MFPVASSVTVNNTVTVAMTSAVLKDSVFSVKTSSCSTFSSAGF